MAHVSEPVEFTKDTSIIAVTVVVIGGIIRAGILQYRYMKALKRLPVRMHKLERERQRDHRDLDLVCSYMEDDLLELEKGELLTEKARGKLEQIRAIRRRLRHVDAAAEA